ncbi:MAG: phosphatase PAP2 family protein [Microscillaceae bacterium]|nr:phosphatase PAP2 family protein [Microscillaceae bacterium]
MKQQLWVSLRRNPGFTGAFLVFALAGGVFLFFCEKGQMVLWLNALHQPGWDIFFKYYTFVGDGFFYALVCLGLFGWRRHWGGLGLLCFALTGLTAQFLKKWIFSDALRPMAFFKDRVELHWVEGVVVHSYQSFPSGHTVTAFSCFCLLALLWPRPIWGILGLGLAMLAGLSRVYLGQHFWVDVYAGAWLGTVFTWLIFALLLPYLEVASPGTRPQKAA